MTYDGGAPEEGGMLGDEVVVCSLVLLLLLVQLRILLVVLVPQLVRGGLLCLGVSCSRLREEGVSRGEEGVSRGEECGTLLIVNISRDHFGTLHCD